MVFAMDTLNFHVGSEVIRFDLKFLITTAERMPQQLYDRTRDVSTHAADTVNFLQDQDVNLPKHSPVCQGVQSESA